MARMNLRARRDAPGMSVFWMILAVGAGVFVLVGLVIFTAGNDMRVEPEEPEIIAGEGDEPPGTSSFTEGEVAEPASSPGEVGELDESVPETGQADDSVEAGTAGPVDADPAEPAPDSPLPPGEDEVEADEPDIEPELPVQGEAEPAAGEPVGEDPDASVGTELEEEVDELEEELQE